MPEAPEKSLILKMVTPMISKTVASLQHSTWHITESQRHTLNSKLPAVEGPKNAQLNMNLMVPERVG